MKLLDDVRVIVDKEEYKKAGIKKNMIGTIIDADIRWNSFFVCFQDQRVFDKDFMNKEEMILDTYFLHSKTLELIKKILRVIKNAKEK